MDYVHQRAEDLALLIYSGGECPEGLTVYEEKRAAAGPLDFIARIIGESHAVSVTCIDGTGLTEVLACVPGEAIPGEPLMRLPVTGPWPLVAEIGGWSCVCRVETRRFDDDAGFAEGFWTARSFLDAPPEKGCAYFPTEKIECRFPEDPGIQDTISETPGIVSNSSAVGGGSHLDSSNAVPPMTCVAVFRCCCDPTHEGHQGAGSPDSMNSHGVLAWKSLHTYTDERTLILSETVVTSPARAAD